ncbi:hypothetical protein SNOG_02916 [Parastagonospora nodorum SN15]|uniref:Uncharacterized protein n=1 Tax=Phaeosphaeria nodorum (strain SN15 / ATCC MYA-4574 / FGSC 10173) TaxID=321614 RepID=Q0UZ98_PHANO|nr:hypothetical protein SNOG_02916 [Parastagonospora nodorum SN15]EAT89647.1 hypothetical protein SNOG_02916 [Parastagonospora nodorum SN15]
MDISQTVEFYMGFLLLMYSFAVPGACTKQFRKQRIKLFGLPILGNVRVLVQMIAQIALSNEYRVEDTDLGREKTQAFSPDSENLVDIAPEVLDRISVATPIASWDIEPPSDQGRRLSGVISMVIEA